MNLKQLVWFSPVGGAVWARPQVRIPGHKRRGCQNRISLLVELGDTTTTIKTLSARMLDTTQLFANSLHFIQYC